MKVESSKQQHEHGKFSNILLYAPTVSTMGESLFLALRVEMDG